MGVHNKKRQPGRRAYNPHAATVGRAVLFAALCCLLSACHLFSPDASHRYITWDGLEPDTWASIWLVSRHIDPGADVIIRPPGSPVAGGTAFGTPGAQYRRQHGRSIYASLMDGFGVTDPVLQEMTRVVHDIEIAPWSNDSSPHSGAFEQAFRQLQEQFPERRVPIACYSRFFDLAYQALDASMSREPWQTVQQFAANPVNCAGEEQLIARRDRQRWVLKVEINDVLNRLAAGEKIIFVDARETPEFESYHIPGAVNLKLREVDSSAAGRFRGADLVIAYCIKDFRGYELARALADAGVDNAAIMKPYGIAGWRALGLPTTGIDGLSETQALQRLDACAQGVERCG